MTNMEQQQKKIILKEISAFWNLKSNCTGNGERLILQGTHKEYIISALFLIAGRQ